MVEGVTEEVGCPSDLMKSGAETRRMHGGSWW